MRDIFEKRGLYRPESEHGSCGIGMVARTDATDTHRTVELALGAVSQLEHRGAVGADGNSSDGSGLLTSLPVRFLGDQLAAQDIVPPAGTRLVVGMAFLPRKPAHAAERTRAILSEEIERVGAEVYMWRVVPLDRTSLGDNALRAMPRVEQVICGVEQTPRITADEVERRLYVARRRAEKRFATEGAGGSHICSLSSQTVVYKGLVLSTRIGRLFPDLLDPCYEARVAVFHQRFSTNTFPSWPLAQPLRCVAHNGEFNTLRGNLSWLSARERTMSSRLLGDALEDVLPVTDITDSDSASFDRLFELLVRAGRDPARVLSMLMPGADHPRADEAVRAMYRYQASLAEAWDGPAAMVATDGRVAVAGLDRNGLRPMRYQITKDGWLCVASESGLLHAEADDIIESDRLGPGRMIEVDLVSGGVRNDVEIETSLAAQHPFGTWLRNNTDFAASGRDTGDGPGPHKPGDGGELLRLQRLFAWDREDLERVVFPMAKTGATPVGSMGDDSAVTPLSTVPQPLSRFFRQRFAQVTNPPLDPIRERCMFSLETPLGRHSNMLEDSAEAVELALFHSPVIDERGFGGACSIDPEATVTLRAVFTPGSSLEDRARALAEEAARSAADGMSIMVVSDRIGPGETLAPVPMVLAVAAVHRALVEAEQRPRCSIVCETADAKEDHDIACLLGFGATLVYPYLAIESVRAAMSDDPEMSVANYIQAAEAGLLKAMSRMGVSVLRSYRGGQLFESLGLDRGFVDRWFPGVPAPIGGHDAGFFERQALEQFEASTEPVPLTELGRYRFRKGGEAHGFGPASFKLLHKAVQTGDRDAFEQYARSANDHPPRSIRDLIDLHPAGEPVPLEEVEPIEAIIVRFVTGAMSHGALSREAHEVLAVAMNRIGGRSNSGEGGEEQARYKPYTDVSLPQALEERHHAAWKPQTGDWGASTVKQVASGRFGVTAAYLASATELEIKMAQGAKPGEGGQIPGFKVSEEIALLRGAAPGTTLISPPPHHDIYSIEDLAELIHDLKSVNRRARVGVKLVASSGVGTIAAGVVKAHADVVQISGHEGGTGASPLSALKHAGLPWELGLAETHQTLVLNGLRSRVRVRVDGGLRTGRDVAIAAALGADEYGFGTVALVSAGCIMARKCHQNTCPVGVATQDPALRAKFPGTPERVIAFMTFVAEEMRHTLAALGLRRVSELIGRSDLLHPREIEDGDGSIPAFDLSDLLVAEPQPLRVREARNDRANPSGDVDDRMLADFASHIDAGVPARRSYRVVNSDRAVGARLAGEIGRIHGPVGLPDPSFELTFTGTSGQSFGAFCTNGMDLTLEGEAQDFVGKSMSGGSITIRSAVRSGHGTRPPVVMGNAVLYGATGGVLLAAGRAGERFAVRNSGASAVIEGCGEHGCEYMTDGTIVVLGSIGRNFGAGMNGGVAYLLDPAAASARMCNPETIERAPVDPDSEAERNLVELLELYASRTRSRLAADVLRDWSAFRQQFTIVRPKAVDAVPQLRRAR
mgnify:CR=1 FL=1